MTKIHCGFCHTKIIVETINTKNTMRYIAIILFSILVGCKNETKTKSVPESKIDKSVYEMWHSFTESNPELKQHKMPESWFFHYNEEEANRLAELIVSGKKRAGSSLYFWYEEAKADLPPVGTKHIITDFDGKAKAIIEIKKVDTIPFNKIPKDYAEMDMGTKIEPLKKWRKAHWDFFMTEMGQSGESPTEDMLIVCEIFETIWTERH